MLYLNRERRYAWAMEEFVRQQYLSRLGIQAWVRRVPQAGVSDASKSSAPDEVVPAMSEAGSEVAAGTDLDIAACDWARLGEAVASCAACALHDTRTRTVFGVGSQEADWLFVGEAPGAEEDRQGEPFVGRAGKLLDAMLRALGHERRAVYIANVLKCRPPNNRDPHSTEIEKCLPYLYRQIALLSPRVIVALGRHAAHNLLHSDAPLSRLRGRVHEYEGIPVVVTYHPAYLLRAPQDKAKAWADLRLAAAQVADA